MNTEFVNRREEFDIIKELLQNKTDTSCGSLLLLYSKSGIGKARLIEEYIKIYYPVSLCINVKIPNSPNLFVESYCYFNNLYMELCQNKKDIKPTFSGISIPMSFAQLHFDIGSNNNYPSKVNSKLKSVQNFFKKYTQPVIITIENIQSIDKESLSIFRSLLNEFSNLQFFMLYNINESYTRGMMYSFFEGIKKFSAAPNPIPICKLEYPHVVEALGYTTKEFPHINELEKVYKKHDGNMDELIVYSIENNASKQAGCTQAIKSLSPDAKFVMYILLYYMGEMSVDELIELLKSVQEFNRILKAYKKIFEELAQKHIIEFNNDRISMNNSIIGYLEKTDFFEEAYVANSIVVENSWNKLKQDNCDFSALYRLAYIYSLHSDKEIIYLFPYIKRLGSISGNIKELLRKTENICTFKYTASSFKEAVILGIVDILYTVGECELARQKLNKIFRENNLQHEMYNLALKGVLNENSFETYAKKLIEKYKSSPRVVLFCKYMYLYHIMHHNSSSVAKNYAKDILDTAEYQQYIEYYFVLKNYSVYLNNDEAIRALQKCIYHFCLCNRKDLAIRTQITLAMRNANIGNLKLARSILNAAERENKYACREYYFLNNFAVINILEKQFEDTIETDLKNALLFSPTTYEQGIILSNLLIYYCETSSWKHAKDIARRLELPQYHKYTFEQYRHIIHYNLYYYYSLIGDSTNQHHHYLALKDLYNACPIDLKDYMDATLFGELELSPNHRRHFYCRYPYRPDYIGYWQLEVPDFKGDCPECF